MSAAAANAVSLTLALIDLACRTWRIQLLLAGLGSRIRRWDAFALIAFSDAAAALTPWRVGGEPAMLFGIRRASVAFTPALVSLAAEAALTYAVVLPLGVLLAAAYGGDWWRALSATGLLDKRAAFVAVACAAGLGVLGVILHRRNPHLIARGVARLRAAMSDLRHMPRRVVAGATVLSVASVLARVAILPVLTRGVPEPPPVGVATLASYGLLYGQLVMPTPSGAGPIDIALFAGAPGEREAKAGLLTAWRFYTTILVIVIGLAAGLLAYGRSALSVFRRAK